MPAARKSTPRSDTTDLSLDRKAKMMRSRNQLLRLLDILIDIIVRTIEHDGSKASLDTCIGTIIGTMIKMQSNRNRDTKRSIHRLYHRSNCLEAAHILTGTHRYTENNRRLLLLTGSQYRLRPLEIVDIELWNSIMTG